MDVVDLEGGYTHTPASIAISGRCPRCRHLNTFEPLPIQDLLLQQQGRVVGLRGCTNAQCRAVIFFSHVHATGVGSFFPPEVIDFDASNLPEPVLKAFEEAVKSHAIGCYSASALMVRKTLEMLCADQGAKGKDLAERLAALRESVILPPVLFDGMTNLRFLGNDAGHVESRVFDDVGQEEVEVAITFAKEVLKAVYQLGDLVAKLEALKRSEETGSTPEVGA